MKFQRKFVKIDYCHIKNEGDDTFDYQDYYCLNHSIKATSASYLLRKGKKVIQAHQEPPIKKNAKYLMQLHTIPNVNKEIYFAISPVFIEKNNPAKSKCKKLYLNTGLTYSKNKAYRIAQGDVIKLGQVRFRIKELKGADPANHIKNFHLRDLLINTNLNAKIGGDGNLCTSWKVQCRICFNNHNSEENPLISPCSCEGSMKYIHLKCLKFALTSKLDYNCNENVLTLSQGSFICDFCKCPYPSNFTFGNSIFELIDIPKPPEKYIILEDLKKDQGSFKYFHIISFSNKNSIIIGRSLTSDIGRTEISMSRLHCIISFSGENFYIEDQDSRFGTLVQIKRPILIEPSFNLYLQAGATIIQVCLKNSWSLIPPCCRPASPEYDFFQENPRIQGIPLLPFGTGIPLSLNPLDNIKNKDFRYHDDLFEEIKDCKEAEAIESDLITDFNENSLLRINEEAIRNENGLPLNDNSAPRLNDLVLWNDDGGDNYR